MDNWNVDETLRMIARLPAPEGLEERVKAALQLAETPGRVLAWPTMRRAESVWIRSGWARGAAAAAIALVVAGGGWRIYSRIEPAQSAKGGALPQAQPSGAFNEAGAMRRPLTVTGPTVKPAVQPALEPTPQRVGKTVGVGVRKSDAAKVQAQGSASRVTAPIQ
jgi:hypothetical protein